MCGCSGNLMGAGVSNACACKLQIDNTASSVIRFCIDNNPQAVFGNLEKAGIKTFRMSKEDATVFLTNAYESGWDISGIINVPYLDNADNYTGGLREEVKNQTGKSFGETYTGQLLATILGGISVGLGTQVFAGNGNPQTLPQPEEPIYQKPVFWIVIAAIVLVVTYFVVKKRK